MQSVNVGDLQDNSGPNTPTDYNHPVYVTWYRKYSSHKNLTNNFSSCKTRYDRIVNCNLAAFINKFNYCL